MYKDFFEVQERYVQLSFNWMHLSKLQYNGYRNKMAGSKTNKDSDIKMSVFITHT